MSSKATYDLTLKLSTNSAELKKGIDEANRKMDGFQKNVGTQLTSIKNSFIAAAAVIATLKGALDTVKKGMNETGEGADNLERFTIKLKEGFDSLAKSIVQADFANMINNWKTASKAAGEYADSMDLVNDRLKDLSVKRASVASSVSMLRAKQAEGTLTKAEAAELKQSTEDLLRIEQEIYDAAIAAQIKFIADKSNLNAELFSNLEDGINRRVEMNEEELKALDNYVQNYKEYKQKLIQENTELAKFQGTGGGPMGNTGSTTMVTNMNKVNEALEEYLAHIPEVARLQIFQQQIAGSEEYEKLIDFYIKRNNLEGEYAGLLRRTISAQSKGSAPSTPIARVGGITPISTANLTIPSLAPNIDTTKLAEPAKVFKESWVDSLTTVNEQIQNLGNTFAGLAAAIEQASEDGKVSFGESMKIIQEAAMTTVSLLGALAAAQIISAEASKGIIGIVTAVAGLAMLMNIWSSFVTPDKYESGTGYASGGWAIVGERGPETVYLPRGSKVQTAAQTRAGISGDQEIKLRLVGTDLVGALKLQARSNNSYA